MGNKEKDKTEKISIFDLIYIISSRWKLIFFTTMGAALFILLFAIGSIYLERPYFIQKFGKNISYLPNFYKPSVEVLFPKENDSLSNILGAGSDLLSLIGKSSGSSNNKANLSEILLFRNQLLDKLIIEQDLFELLNLEPSDGQRWYKARKFLIDGFEVSNKISNGTMIISFKNTDYNIASQILLRAVELLEKQYKEVSRERAIESISFLSTSITKAEIEMNRKLDELTAFQKRYNIIDPLKQLEIKSEATTRLENEIVLKQLKIDEIAAYTGYNDPQVQQAQKEIRRLKKALKMQIKGTGLKSEYNIPIAQLLEVGPEYSKLKQELKGLTNIYQTLRSQQYAKELQMTNASSTFQIISKPNLNEGESPMKAGPSRGKLCILFTLVVFSLSVFATFLLEFLKRIKDDPEESQKLEAIKAQLPSIALMKKFKKKK